MSVRQMVLELEARRGGTRNLPLRRFVNRKILSGGLPPTEYVVQNLRRKLKMKKLKHPELVQYLQSKGLSLEQYKILLQGQLDKKKMERIRKMKEKRKEKAEMQRQNQLSLAELRQEGIIPKSPRDRDRPEQEPKPQPKPKGFRCVVQ